VVGASVNGVILLLPAEFVKLALIANVIARPTAYAVMQRWLQTFAYQVNPASEYVYFQASLP
jgi:putative ABC transport system permease protein